MGYDIDGKHEESSEYVLVTAGVTTAAVGNRGCYLERLIIIPASSGAGTVTLIDGSTTIMVTPTFAGIAGAAERWIDLGIRATNASTGFKITTGSSVSVIAVGRFGTVLA